MSIIKCLSIFIQKSYCFNTFIILGTISFSKYLLNNIIMEFKIKFLV